MRLMGNKLLLFVLCFVCLLNFACGQTQAEKQKLIAEYEQKAYDLRMQGNNKAALNEQLKAVELDSKDAESLMILTGIYIDLQNWQKAEESAKKAVEIAPKNYKTHYQLAVVLERKEDTKGALKSFQEAVRLNSTDTNTLINLGTIYEDIGDKISARKYYEKALELDPAYVPAIYLLGTLEEDKGNFEEAIKLYKQAVETELPEEKKGEQLGSQRDAQKRLDKLQKEKDKK